MYYIVFFQISKIYMNFNPCKENVIRYLSSLFDLRNVYIITFSKKVILQQML